MSSRRALLLLPLLVTADCARPCDFDADCEEGHACRERECVPLDEEALRDAALGRCKSDRACASGELCYEGACVDATMTDGWSMACPEAPAADELVCTNWDPQECPCYAGEVRFHERELDGVQSCGGLTGIYSDRVRLKQVGCHVEALGGELAFDAIRFGELRVRFAQLPNDTSCSAFGDRWASEPTAEGLPAVRLECAPDCTMWLQMFDRPAPERIVPDAEFLLGTPDELAAPGGEDERPAHLVRLLCFYVDRFEVSRRAYRECLDDGACEPPEYAAAGTTAARFFETRALDLPITWIDHRRAEQYCSFRGKALPTEAEWERAALGTRWRATPWPWGSEPPFTVDGAPDCEIANFAGCGGAPLPTTNGGGEARDDDDVGIDAKPDGASYFDAVDLGGNVREWTRDFYRADAYAVRAATADPHGTWGPEQTEPHDGSRDRVVRGGSYLSPIDPAAWPPVDELRASARDHLDEATTAADVGFRCVRYKPGVAR